MRLCRELIRICSYICRRNQAGTILRSLIAAIPFLLGVSQPGRSLELGITTAASFNTAIDLECTMIYNPGNGWLIDQCNGEPSVPEKMAVYVDGTFKGDAALVRVYHQSESWQGSPQVMVIYASGFLRLKPNADPAPPIPFGSSFILGPGYWSSPTSYHHSPVLRQLNIDTQGLPDLPLRMRAEGQNQDFETAYEMALPPPTDRQTRLHVSQTYTATASVSIDPARISEHQGFKLVQISSMFINLGATCDGGYSDCHDSDAARYIGSDLGRHEIAYKDLIPPTFIFNAPVTMGSTWLDGLHSDDLSWQGNTPNVRIALDELAQDRRITPKGWIESTSDPNQDNVNLWLHEDGADVQTWYSGKGGQIAYWLLAEDDPPEPWEAISLRNGFTFLDFEGSHDCFPVLPTGLPVSGSIQPILGYKDTALELHYDLGGGDGNWAQVRCNFDPPLDLSGYDHLRLDWRGDPQAANSMQVGLIGLVEGKEAIFARGYQHASQHGWWGQWVIPFSFLQPWTEGTSLDPSQVSALFISLVKDPQDDSGNAGSIAIDNLSAFNASGRSVPTSFEQTQTIPLAAQAAAEWLAAQQQASGLLKSWQEETACISHTYDQALALIVFSKQGMWPQADSLVEVLAETQNEDGSWYKSRNCETLAALDSNKWEGDIAWAIYALNRYLVLGGRHPAAYSTLQRGATWLASRTAADGCLTIDHTEGTIDAWWAFQAAGKDFASYAEGIKTCLLSRYWDEAMGRFKGGMNWQQPYLDNQTWGAAFLKAVNEPLKARRALSYAWQALRLPGQGGQLFGFDGQAGTWSVWNEGSGQYSALGGEGASVILNELLAQQETDGSLPSSPDAFSGGGVWTTGWHGVAPTAWLYNALNDEPFHPGRAFQYSIYLPEILKR
jgi:hypothetical protein